MSNILQEIEAQIAGVKTAAAKQNVGIVRESGDGVARTFAELGVELGR